MSLTDLLNVEESDLHVELDLEDVMLDLDPGMLYSEQLERA